MYSFWDRVDKKSENPCWVWTRPKTDLGYGVYFNKAKRFLAHRYSFELKNGKIPRGLVLDHLCRNPACIRPDHLEAVTQKENVLRSQGTGAKFARRKRCLKGHPFTEENTFIRTDGGARKCRKCMKEYAKTKDQEKSRWSRMSTEQKIKSRDRLRGWQAKQRLKKLLHN